MLLELRAAREWRVRPSELREVWPERDRLAAIALVAHEASIGPCGHPHDETTGDMEGWYEVHDDQVCWACYARDEYEKDHRETGPPSGAIVRVVDTRHGEE